MTAPFPGAVGDAVERVVLGNGLTVLLRRDTSAPVVAIVTYVKAGYFDETDDVVGIAHVLEHMYFKGTPTRGPGEIARETKAAGGYLNAGTIYDHTSYYTVLPSASVFAGLAVQADAYANSLIDAGELARELEVIIEEERRKRDTPSAVAAEACYALLHDAHRMRRWRIGTPEGLRKLSREDVVRFYHTQYAPSNTVLCVVGDIDTGAVLREVERLYGALGGTVGPKDRGPAEPDRRGLRARELVRDVRNAQLVMAWRTVPPDHADAPALDIAASVLGSGRASRLYQELRVRSLASVVGAYHYTPTELGVFAVTAETHPDQLAAATKAAWAEVAQVSLDGRVTEGELQRVRQGIDASWRRRLESMEGQASYLAAWEATGAWEDGARYLDRLLSVTPAEVTERAARYLTPDRAAVVTVRSADAEPVTPDAAAVERLLAGVSKPAQRRRESTPLAAPMLAALGRAPERVEDGISIFTTDGGVPVLVKRKPGAPIAYAQVLFAGGVSEENVTNAGVTLLLARAALQGTAHRDGPQLAEDIESLGGAIGNVGGVESFGWTVSVPTPRLYTALEILAEVAERPALGADALETERAAALTGLARLKDDMSRQPARLALAAVFGDHPYGRPALGSERGLQECTVATLRAWHERQVRGGHGVIVVVADADAGEVAAAVRGAMRGLTQNARADVRPPRWTAPVPDAVESRTRAQTALSVVFPGVRRDDPKRRAAGLLALVASGLGGRFFMALRDAESLAYSVSVGAHTLPAAGWVSAYLACAPEKEAAARAGLLRECRRLIDEPVTPEELARAKAYALGALAIRQQSAAAVLSDIADAWLFSSLGELEEEPRAIAAVTAEEITAVAVSAFEQPGVWGIVRGG